METYKEKVRAERICDIMFRVSLSLMVLLMVAVVSGAAVRYLGAPKLGETYYSTKMNTDFTEDTVFVRPLEMKGRYVKYEFCYGSDTLEAVCSILSFNASHSRYRDNNTKNKNR